MAELSPESLPSHVELKLLRAIPVKSVWGSQTASLFLICRRLVLEVKNIFCMLCHHFLLICRRLCGRKLFFCRRLCGRKYIYNIFQSYEHS